MKNDFIAKIETGDAIKMFPNLFFKTVLLFIYVIVAGRE
jgi:hypothetical protein